MNSIMDVTGKNGKYINKSKLYSAFEQKQIPMISRINLITKNEQKTFFYHEIKLIKTESIELKYWSTLIGFTIDF
jgi:pSer/pThr/pTyr-binding forkhead associated (FHA) protein